MICTKCNKESQESWSFCDYCGTKLIREEINNQDSNNDLKEEQILDASLKAKASNLPKSLIIGGFVIAFIVTAISITVNNNQINSLIKNKNEKLENPSNFPTPQPVKYVKPKYQIINDTQSRSDGASIVYVLIDPIDYSNNNFMDEVKTVIKDIVGQYGIKVTINVFDDKKAINLDYYKNYGSSSGNYYDIVQEDDFRAIHYIAYFSGGMEDEYLNNKLNFFLAIETYENFGSLYNSLKKYKDEITFIPQKYTPVSHTKPKGKQYVKSKTIISTKQISKLKPENSIDSDEKLKTVDDLVNYEISKNTNNVSSSKEDLFDSNTVSKIKVKKIELINSSDNIQNYERVSLYLNRLQKRIYSNWSFNDIKGKGKVVIHFKINKKGLLTDIEVVESVNKEIEESVMRAIYNSSPFDQPPIKYNGDFITMPFIVN